MGSIYPRPLPSALRFLRLCALLAYEHYRYGARQCHLHSDRADKRVVHGAKAAHSWGTGVIPQVPLNDKKMYPIYAKCVELDIAAIVYVGVPGPRIRFAPQDPALLDEVCWYFPELRIITRHGGQPWTDLMVKLLLKWPNLYYSTSAFAPKHYDKAIIDFANTRGADKVIYAGYYPMGLDIDRIFAEMPAVPFLWVVGTGDRMYQRGEGYAYARAPRHPKSKYLVVKAGHKDTPNVARAARLASVTTVEVITDSDYARGCAPDATLSDLAFIGSAADSARATEDRSGPDAEGSDTPRSLTDVERAATPRSPTDVERIATSWLLEGLPPMGGREPPPPSPRCRRSGPAPDHRARARGAAPAAVPARGYTGSGRSAPPRCGSARWSAHSRTGPVPGSPGTRGGARAARRSETGAARHRASPTGTPLARTVRATTTASPPPRR